MQIKVNSEDEMEVLGGCLAQVLAKDDVVYLRGELGAGKTVLVRGAARGLGYQGRVTSPTFTLMNIYPGSSTIYHFDFYRLESADLADLGLEEFMENGGISLVEWPQIGQEVLPGEALWVDIALTDDDYDLARTVHISARGDRYQDKLERLRQIVNSGHR
ncbi:MAG: tRNA (adenosine(37)-N6)-threonylcarbamoyltransferase complex ATPase subunit type 1 TsaE [Syntrophomonadaceae bacterium]|nr:tRNA (adenosine(37)-N6)-threonylcarbamoyltransferase complex ATPase subunit type 1 TsaE [Syntrophomonadaceae bacterium]